VPIAGHYPPRNAATGWREAIGILRAWLAVLQRTAPGPDAINQGPRHLAANLLYHVSAWLGGSEAEHIWRVHTQHLSRQVLEVARRDAGRRILVVVNVRHCHVIRRELRKHDEVEVVPYVQL
jgi:hypothetical protein